MEPVSLIVGALAVCAGEAGKAIVSEGVKDAYAKLKVLVSARFRGRPSGELVLAQHEQKPDDWAGALRSELAEVRAGDDARLIEAAQKVMAAADPMGAQSGKYNIQIQNAQGVQLGDRNTQTNTFGNFPPPLS